MQIFARRLFEFSRFQAKASALWKRSSLRFTSSCSLGFCGTRRRTTLAPMTSLRASEYRCPMEETCERLWTRPPANIHYATISRPAGRITFALLGRPTFPSCPLCRSTDLEFRACRLSCGHCISTTSPRRRGKRLISAASKNAMHATPHSASFPCCANDFVVPGEARRSFRLPTHSGMINISDRCASLVLDVRRFTPLGVLDQIHGK